MEFSEICDISGIIVDLCDAISKLSVPDQVDMLNTAKVALHGISPFKSEPVDCVLWVKNDTIVANDYNPNTVAPPEMKLLETSITNDGYTQPIVTWPNNDKYEVVDGFHRNRVGKESDTVRERVLGYLPAVVIRKEQESKSDRIASTIRHNRARGKHRVEAMSDIVVELKNRNWANDRICRELGMEEDEVLRLCQITGLADLFSDQQFSKSWDIKDSEPDDFIPLEDDFDNSVEKETNGFRTVNTSDENRVFHTYDKWECYKAGFYNSSFKGKTKDECEQMYADFLSDDAKFRDALGHVISEWKHSCEHYLTNESMNRIAYLGQAAMCYATGVPSEFRSGFELLTEEQQERANSIALEYLNLWLSKQGFDKADISDAIPDRQSTIY